jgi:hypothetical protein
MKIAAIALASAFAAAAAFAQPAFAQQNFDQGLSNQFNQQQGGQGMQNQTPNWRGGGNFRNETQGQNENWGGGMRQGGPHMRFGRFVERGAFFAFRRGDARMLIRCPATQPLQACVNAAGQLLDKVANLRGGSGGTTGSGSPGNSPQSGNQPSSSQPGSSQPSSSQQK